MSATFTISMEEDEKQRLEALAKSTGRSRSTLAADAIRAYLDVQEWQVEGVLSAQRSVAEKGGVEQAAVRSWVESWDGQQELVRPRPRRL